MGGELFCQCHLWLLYHFSIHHQMKVFIELLFDGIFHFFIAMTNIADPNTGNTIVIHLVARIKKNTISSVHLNAQRTAGSLAYMPVKQLL